MTAIISKTYTDTRGRKRKTIQNGQITTEFYHNAVNELVKVRNTKGYETKYEYDLAGRRVKEMHPDRGTTTFAYNNMGQVTQKQTANLMLGSAGSIEYAYNYHRLTNITYPDRPENNVEYVYGTSGNQTGKIVLQKDATGIQWFRYGMLGELTFAGRAIAVAGKTSYWFTTSWEYDSWNRIHKITYPDHEEVTYKYDPAGQLKAVESDISGVNTADIVTNITYNQYGERQRIDYGNGTFTEYDYDDLRRMDELKHTFSTHDIFKQYTYDKVSNVIKIATDPSQNLNIMPTNGELAGPLEHNYTYDDFNRLIKADGWYVGPDDEPGDLLRQEYTLDMAYDESHNILNKAQNHLRGSADPNDPNIFPSNVVPEAMEDTAYNLDYEDYASGSFTAGGHSYVQPHAPRTIVEYPFGAGAEEPSAKRKLLDYDANGNLLLVEQEISDPEDPLGKAKISLRENLWDEEDRLRAVDLKPEAPGNKPEVAAYTYDASGERSIKYLPGRLDAYYSAKAAGSADRLESILYPSPLLTVKTRPLPEHMEPDELSRTSITKYTKHYYIGTERISSAIGTMKNLGLLCENNWPGNNDLVNEMGTKTIDAGSVLIADYDTFEKELQLSEPFIYETYLPCEGRYHEPDNYAAYWYHPDHLGSSSYITNLDGNINQHMEYLPFGETLVEEHLNSYNSPYKFNAKELDKETGWYYYGARYYNPKWSIWLSVDPLAEKFPGWSPYNYTLQNPIRYVDPDGRYPRPLMRFDPKLGLYGGYKLKRSSAHLLSLVSGVSESMIQSATIQKRAPGQYRPFYSAKKGGGAITLGTGSYNASITYTENWFEDNASKYNGNGFGQDIEGWLEHLSHEVGHLPQIDEAGGLVSYLGEFAAQYADAGNHDGAPNEIEADKGSSEFVAFNAFVDEKYGENTLIDVMSATEEDNGYKGTESYKIKQIDTYWKEYQNSLKDE